MTNNYMASLQNLRIYAAEGIPFRRQSLGTEEPVKYDVKSTLFF